MPLRINRGPAAKRDFLDIWEYISPNSQKGAERTIHSITARISMLASQPDAGRARPELGESTRSFPVGNYIIFYSHTATTLNVFRILHSAHDITPEMLAE